MRVLAVLLCSVAQAWTVKANVEKTIFLGPHPVPLPLPNARPSLDSLALHTLSPSKLILPVQLPLQFPSASQPRGLDSWYLVQGLQEGKRYEVRVCWPATQPTDFWLDTFPITHVLDTPDLISSLARYSDQAQFLKDQLEPHKEHTYDTPDSLLFLRIQAAGSYYSTNRTLMDFPPPVHADIILDPFILNIFPQSLAAFAIYVSAVAVGAWFLSGFIYRWLIVVAAEGSPKPHID
ncbi:hypothetical protein IQ07DRAFT_171748 [Pyrenochaeta sp. DS3sAY3a]|nr:hypothetical protein IQ07DRAFT_171748 [Pyrenochaeta sp. DS3sAY3a]